MLDQIIYIFLPGILAFIGVWILVWVVRTVFEAVVNLFDEFLR